MNGHPDAFLFKVLLSCRASPIFSQRQSLIGRRLPSSPWLSWSPLTQSPVSMQNSWKLKSLGLIKEFLWVFGRSFWNFDWTASIHQSLACFFPMKTLPRTCRRRTSGRDAARRRILPPFSSVSWRIWCAEFLGRPYFLLRLLLNQCLHYNR